MTSRRVPAREAEELAVAEELISLLRHDARNKLSAVRQAGTYLRTRTEKTALWTEDPRVPRFFALIDEQLLVADGILDRFDALARVHDRAPTRLEPARIVAAAVAAVPSPGQVRITTAVAPGRPRADEHELVLALRHLIENAIDVSPPGGSVAIEGATGRGSYVFRVRDEGPGLAPQDLARLARPFVSTRDDRRGLGLAIARRVAMRWGGGLAVVPTEHGATLELTVGEEAP